MHRFFRTRTPNCIDFRTGTLKCIDFSEPELLQTGTPKCINFCEPEPSSASIFLNQNPEVHRFFFFFSLNGNSKVHRFFGIRISSTAFVVNRDAQPQYQLKFKSNIFFKRIVYLSVFFFFVHIMSNGGFLH